MIGKHWEHFAQNDEMGVRGIGRDKAEAFEQAALALTAVIATPQMLHPQEEIAITCDAPTDDLLLADWLNALLFEMGSQGLLCNRFEVQLSEHHLEGRAWGERLEQGRFAPSVEGKGAAFGGSQVAQEADGAWVAQSVLSV